MGIDIYRKGFFEPDMEQQFEAIEKALGFELFVWQKTYIERGEFRQFGKTTAEAIRELIVPGNIINYSEPPRNSRERFHRRILFEIKQKFEESGIKTNPVARSKEELYKYMNERGIKQHESNDFKRYRPGRFGRENK